MQNDDNNVSGLSPLGLPYQETEEDKAKRASATREQLSQALEDLKRLKESLSKSEGKVALDGEVDGLQEFIKSNQDTIGGLNVEIEKAKKNITKYKSAITKAEKEYDKSIARIQEIVDEQNKRLDSADLLSEEEISRFREEFNEKKITELSNAQEFKRQIESLRNGLDILKEELKTLTIASSLGLSATEYLEISNSVQSNKFKKIMKGVYTSLGLEEIVSKSSSERTPEEKEKLSLAKEEVMKQIAEYRREHKEASVLDSIQVLYNLDVKMTKKGSIKSVSLNGEEIKMLKKKVSTMPAKVPDFEKQEDLGYTPDPTPSDMNGVNILTSEEIHERFDKVHAYEEEQAKLLKMIRSEYDKREKKETEKKDEVTSVNSDIQLPDVVYDNEKADTLTSQEIKKLFDEKLKADRDQNYVFGLINDQFMDGPNKNRDNLNSTTNDVTNDASDDALDVIYENINAKSEDITVDEANDDALEEIDVNDISKTVSDIKINNDDENVEENINTERGYVAMTPEEILKAQINIEYDKDGNKYSDYEQRLRDSIDEFFENHPEMRTGLEGESRLATLKRVSDAFYEDTGLDFRVDRPGEYIPGTNILMPRHRFAHESDEEYASFLEEYYNEVFPKKDEVEEFTDEETLSNETVNIDQPIVDDTNGIETVTLFESENKDEFYVRSYTVGRYELHSASNPERIGGALCYRISREDMERLVNGSDDLSNVSPYHIVTQTYHRGDDNSIELGNVENTNENELDKPKEKTLYNSKNTNNVTKPVDNNNDISMLENRNINNDILMIEDKHKDDGILMIEDKHKDDDILMLEDHQKDPARITMKDTITLYHETDNDDYYANQEVVDRFSLPIGDLEIINGNEHFKIPRDQAEQIIDSANNNQVADYLVDVVDFQLDKDKQDEPVQPSLDDDDNKYLNNENNITKDTDDNNNNDGSNDDKDNNDSLDPIDPIPPIPPIDTVNTEDTDTDKDKVVLYRDVNDDTIYVTPDILSTFGVNPSEPDFVDYDGMSLFPINEEGHEQIRQAVDANPDFELEYRDIDLKTKEPIVDGDVVELTLFRDLDDNNQVYAPITVLDEFDIPYGLDPVDINGVPSFRINDRLDGKINEFAQKSVNPKYVVKYEDVHLKKNEVEEKKEPKKPRPHVEAIIQKLTDGLVIKPKDVKRYKADNIHAAKKFKDELKEGNYLYFLTSLLPKTVSFVGNCFKAVAGGLFLGKRGKQVCVELKSRLDNLSDEELEVLFEEYRGHQLKTDMNNQINPLILDRLRRYGMEKVTIYNKQIGEHYTELFVLLGQIDALDKQIAKATGDTKDALIQSRYQLIIQASLHITRIEEIRVKADNLLSGGIHGLEEDFKAVSTKLSYVGKRFAKTNTFDNELQEKLGKYGQGLRDAMANDDHEAVVENFMALESEYAKNTEIKKVSLTGTKSVGSKYYTPLAERFDYRDDPFIRNVFSSIAIATSIYSAINAYKVHQIESQEALRQEQMRADAVNKHNDQVMSQVHQTGADVQSYRGVFHDGMKAQTHDTSLNTSGVFERGNLDKSDWHFSDQYHIDDAQAHIDYNQFHDEAMSGIQNTVSGYATGALSQAQALQQMADVANKAHAHLMDTVAQYKDICANYAANHPEFDLRAFNESMDYLVQNSGAISAMNQGMVDITNLGSTLSSLNNAHMTTLASLPSDMYSTLMASFATCAYVGHIAGSMNHENYNGRYGNDITSMMEDYASSHYDDDDENTRTR